MQKVTNSDKYEVHHGNIISKVDSKSQTKSERNIENCFDGCDMQKWGSLMEAMKSNGHYDEFETQTTIDEYGYHEKRVKV